MDYLVEMRFRDGWKTCDRLENDAEEAIDEVRELAQLGFDVRVLNYYGTELAHLNLMEVKNG
jgi:uncharacterized protein YgfB (UPF0149 family)